jgi:DNA-binding CsgD family transcriptional regulator
VDDGSDLEALQRGRDLARAISHPAGLVRAFLNLDNSLRWVQARPEEAARMRDEGLAVAQENGLRSSECWLWEAEAEAKAEMGDVAGAAVAITRAEALVADFPREYESRVVIEIRRALIDLMTGKPVEVEPRLRELGSHIRAAGHYEVGLNVGAATAVARLAAGDVDGATSVLDDELLPAALATRSAPVWHAMTLALGVAGAVGGEAFAAALPAPLTPWSPSVGADLHTAFGALATGAEPTPGAISANAMTLDAHRFHWHANIVRLLGAIGLSRLPATTEAAHLARSADEWFARVGAPAWSDTARGVLRRLGRRAPTRSSPSGALTAREREVLTLVADGATNRQIAARLVISEPTAARHVANIFTKLRVNSRAEAVRVAAERGLVGQIASST